MRPALNRIQIIERYLRGELDAKELAEIQKYITAHPEFQAEIDTQKEIMEAIERKALKAKIQAAKKKYKAKKTWGKLGFGFGFLALAAFGAFALFSNPERFGHEISGEETAIILEKKEDAIPIYSEEILPQETFEFDTKKDSVFATKNDIVFAVPENAFVDAAGRTIVGSVQIELREALDPVDILKAGLSTTSNGEVLETAGMFFIDAIQNGEKLKLADGKEIYIDIPTDDPNPDMQLFDGERMEDGTINWVNPKPIENFLSTVDIRTLDFYPPNFKDTLAIIGYGGKGKVWTDSVFYAMEDPFPDVAVPMSEESEERFEPAMKIDAITGDTFSISNEKWTMVDDDVAQQKESEKIAKDMAAEANNLFGKQLKPSSIKTFWNKKYNKTVLATNEFEERLQAIWCACNSQEILDLYIKNIKKPLCEIDKLAARKIDGNSDLFKAFAKQGKGRVKVGDKLAARLEAYFQTQREIHAKAAQKAQADFWKKQRRQYKEFANKSSEHWQIKWRRQSENYRKELEINLDEAYRQIGKKRVTARPSGYRTAITTLGPKNLDAFVAEATNARTTLDYTDPDTGKKAVIKYKTVEVSIANEEKFDRCYAYVLIDEINSFVRMPKVNESYSYSFNELLKYNLVCVGYKGEKAYAFSVEDVYKKDSIVAVLAEISNKKLSILLHKFGKRKASRAVLEDLDFEHLIVKDKIRKESNAERKRVAAKLIPVVYPCGTSSKEIYNEFLQWRGK